MNARDVHPLELEFLEAIEFLESAIAAARAASAATDPVAFNIASPYDYADRVAGRDFTHIWIFGGPGTPVTFLEWPWDNPNGWTRVSGSGG